MGITSNFNEILNTDVDSLLSKATLPSTSDISGLNLGSAVSSDKLFASISSSENASNVFGVFDSKQVVQTLTGDMSSMFSSEVLDSLTPDKMKNLMSKLGSDVLTDLELDAAIKTVTDQYTNIKQTSLNAADDLYGSVVNVYDSTGAEIKATLLESVSFDDTVNSVFDNLPSISDFESMQSIFNKGGLSNYNSCDAVGAALAYGKKLFDTSSLFGSIAGLFGLLGQYDISGIVNCFESAVNSFDTLQQIDLASTFVDSGSLNAYNDFSSITNGGSVLNQYNTVRQLGANATSSDQNVLSSLFLNLGVTKESVFTEAVMNTDSNDSILNNMGSPVYDQSAIASSSSGFANYCLGDDTHDTLSNVPSSLFL